MGTRCLTVFHDGDKEIATLYRQMDGYLDGHGKELCEFLAGHRIVNGIQPGATRIFNGMGCLAASVVAYFKDGVGSFYLYPPGSRDCGEEYIYEISAGDTGAIRLKITSYYNTKNSFDGTPEEALKWIAKRSKEQDDD